MDLLVQKKELEATLKAVKPSVSTRATLPALGGVKLDARILGGLQISGTDLEMAIIRRTPASVTEPGECVVPFKPLLQAVSAMAGPEIRIVQAGTVRVGNVDLEVSAGKVWIQSGSRTVTMATLPQEDFPTLVSDPTALSEWFVADSADLANVFGAVTIAASTDEARPVLTSVHVQPAHGQAVWAVSTDSYRMAYRALYTREGHSDRKANLPARVCKVIAAQQSKRKEAGPVVARCGEAQAIFETDDGTTYITRLIEGDFPNWENLIPKGSPVHAVFDSDELEQAVKGVSVFAQNGQPVKFELASSGPSRILAGSQDEGECSEELNVMVKGLEALEGAEGTPGFAFNPDFLLDALKFVGSDAVSMYGRDPLKPFLWANGNVEESAYLLMPVRL